MNRTTVNQIILWWMKKMVASQQVSPMETIGRLGAALPGDYSSAIEVDLKWILDEPQYQEFLKRKEQLRLGPKRSFFRIQTYVNGGFPEEQEEEMMPQLVDQFTQSMEPGSPLNGYVRFDWIPRAIAGRKLKNPEKWVRLIIQKFNKSYWDKRTNTKEAETFFRQHANGIWLMYLTFWQNSQTSSIHEEMKWFIKQDLQLAGSYRNERIEQIPGLSLRGRIQRKEEFLKVLTRELSR